MTPCALCGFETCSQLCVAIRTNTHVLGFTPRDGFHEHRWPVTSETCLKCQLHRKRNPLPPHPRFWNPFAEVQK